MQLPALLQNKIINFLLSLPNIGDNENQQAFIHYACLDEDLIKQIQFGKSAIVFVPRLVSILINYGTLEDGRNAFEAVLETAKKYIGADKKAECEVLIKELHTQLQISCALIRSSVITLENQWEIINQEGIKLYRQERFKEAISSFEKALQEAEKTYGTTFRSAQVLNNLGLIYKSFGEYSQAEQYYLKALEIHKHDPNVGIMHSEYAKGLSNIAELYKAMGLYDKVESLLQEALQIKERYERELQALEQRIAQHLVI